MKERVVHVTEIGKDENDAGSRFIIGAYPAESDRNGEWGAAVSIPDASTPLPGDRVIPISGDAGLCVEEFREWSNEKGFFLSSEYGKTPVISFRGFRTGLRIS